MSEIKRLIENLGPDGVEYRKLGEVCQIMNGKDYKNFPSGDIPVYGTGGIMTHIDTFAYDKPSVLLPRKGSIDKIYYVDVPFWTVDTIYWTKINETVVLPKFLYYCISIVNLAKMNTGTGAIPSLTQAVLKKIEIPVPPLEVQRKIVEVLDNFTELEAELEARRKQYEYYRNALLSFDKVGGAESNVKWMTLGEIGIFYGGLSGKSKKDFEIGNGKFISYMNVYSNITVDISTTEQVNVLEGEKQNSIRFGDVLFTGSSETPEECGMSSVVTTAVQTPIYLNSFCFGFRINDLSAFNAHYLKHIFRSSAVRKQIIKTASGVTRFNVSKKKMADVLIPIPPLSEQQRIVDILDRFEALTTDLQSGLPAEIEARRKQYEYYREKLLTFKRKTA